jgi:hypothetical protein
MKRGRAVPDGVPPAPGCPRCGYDLTGQVDSWAESCPLAIVCSECGLRFDSCDVLNASFAARWRFVEVAQGRRLNALWQTFRRALVPWRFWSWVRMEHPLRVRSAVGWASLAFLGAYAATSLLWFCLAVIEYFAWVTVQPRMAAYNPLAGALKGALLGVLSPWRDDGYFGEALFGSDELKATFTFMALGVLVAVLMPVCFLLLPDTLRRAKVRRAHLVRVCAWSLVTPPLLLQAVTLLLPAVQDWVYLATGNYASRSELLDSIYHRRGKAWFAFLLLWLVLWWWAACGKYLKLPNAAAIAAAMVVMSTLVVIFLSMFVPGMIYYVVE